MEKLGRKRMQRRMERKAESKWRRMSKDAETLCKKEKKGGEDEGRRKVGMEVKGRDGR